MTRRFEGKVVVITGAAGGIGHAAAARLGGEGARLVLVDVAEPGLAESEAAVKAAGGEAITVRADVTEAVGVERYARAAQERWGGVDAFFNNAGILGPVAPLVDYPEDAFDRVMAVNVRAVWLGLKVVGKAMAARGGGAIVNTASIAGQRSASGLIAYAASKHAVIGLTRTAAVELARSRVRVNAIAPSPIETPMVAEMHRGVRPDQPEAVRQRMNATIPLRRYGKPEEVAALVTFLLSAEAEYLTGGIYNVDGGAMA
jgi:NAD(P)-dependent dehydrogenase (short-subunit alcohol dehydrogenase family)